MPSETLEQTITQTLSLVKRSEQHTPGNLTQTLQDNFLPLIFSADPQTQILTLDLFLTFLSKKSKIASIFNLTKRQACLQIY
jgi:hypothetical protein